MAKEWADLVFSGDADAAVLSRAVQRQTLRRLARGVYTGIVDAEPESVVAAHLWQIVDHELPGAVIVDCCAVRARPVDGVLTIDHARTRPLVLPGLTVHVRRGPGPVDGDMPFLGTSLHLSSTARQLLDNLDRSSGSERRTINDDEIEAWIDALIAERGEAGINRLRDQARLLAPQLRRTQPMARLDELISAALTTGDAGVVRSSRLQSRAGGLPIDAARLDAFARLSAELTDTAPDIVVDQPEDSRRRALLPFYEAYFSNFIEGTEFTLDEAEDIIFGGRIPDDRPADAHDVLATYEIVNDPTEMNRTPSDADELEELLRSRHALVMAQRPDKFPGDYKVRANRAGSSLFVIPEQVRGTLREGFAIASDLIGPFERAVFMMFLVSEVHPFADGNGRVARIMMNAELVSAGEVRLVVPIVYRENYLDGLRGATRTGHFAALIKTLAFARKYTAQVDFSSRESAEDDFRRTHALRDAREADGAGVRLLLPSRA